jgi:hypothetical protein
MPRLIIIAAATSAASAIAASTAHTPVVRAWSHYRFTFGCLDCSALGAVLRLWHIVPPPKIT